MRTVWKGVEMDGFGLRVVYLALDMSVVPALTHPNPNYPDPNPLGFIIKKTILIVKTHFPP